MPGVVVTTRTQSGPSSPLRDASGQLFVVGIFERGATDKAIRVRSAAEAVSMIGTRVPYSTAWDQVMEFFGKGGQQAIIGRVIGAAATSGTVTINDRDDTPKPTLKFDAVSSGSWSSRVSVEVLDGSDDTFRVNVYYDDSLVESYSNLSSPAEAAAKFNGSNFVKVTDLGSATTAPDNNPATANKTNLSAGDDKHGTADADDYVSALDLFGEELGSGVVIMPGQTSSAAWEALDAHCEVNERIGYVAGARTDGKVELQAKAQQVDTKRLALFAPWIAVSDGYGGKRFISPEGSVAGRRAVAHDTAGPWRVPAGRLGQLDVLDVDKTFSTADQEALDQAGVSLIRKINSTLGIRVYNYRTLARTERSDYEYLSITDLMNYLTVAIGEVMEEFVFEPIDADGHLQAAMEAALIGLVEPIASRGGLYPWYNEDGTKADEGYKVETGSTVNTRESIAQSLIKARVSVRPSATASLVSVEVVKVALQGNL